MINWIISISYIFYYILSSVNKNALIYILKIQSDGTQIILRVYLNFVYFFGFYFFCNIIHIESTIKFFFKC